MKEIDFWQRLRKVLINKYAITLYVFAALFLFIGEQSLINQFTRKREIRKTKQEIEAKAKREAEEKAKKEADAIAKKEAEERTKQGIATTVKLNRFGELLCPVCQKNIECENTGTTKCPSCGCLLKVIR